MAVTYIETAGGKLAVEVEGEGPLVICSPGMGDHRDAYGPLAAQLVAAGYRVARMDLRGHGDSSIDFKAYGDDPTADDYLTIIDTLGGGPAVLAGASMSGGAAVIAAGRHPGKVAGLILLGAYLRAPGNKLMVNILLFALWRPWGPPFWKYFAKTMWPGLGDKAGERAAESTRLLTRPGRWPKFHATVAGCNHNEAVTPWIEAASQTPALVVIGDKDPDWSAPLEEAKWVASNFKVAETLEVPGVGHAPMFENPDIVGPGVIRFLERIKFNKK